jgi:hypothetical protein
MREYLIIFIIYNTLRRISALFSPDLIITSNILILLALALYLSPVIVFFGILVVGGGVTSKKY